MADTSVGNSADGNVAEWDSGCRAAATRLRGCALPGECIAYSDAGTASGANGRRARASNYRGTTARLSSAVICSRPRGPSTLTMDFAPRKLIPSAPPRVTPTTRTRPREIKRGRVDVEARILRQLRASGYRVQLCVQRVEIGCYSGLRHAERAGLFAGLQR
jgi:hypothetical protein